LSSKKYIQIGQILKPLGTTGELKIEVQDNFFDDFVESDHIFIKINGHFVPYFIENIRETNHLLIKLEEIDDPESAGTFTLKEVFMREQNITSKSYKDQKSKEGWIGFTIYDKEQIVGIIDDIEIFPQQIMASVNINKKMVLIPLVEELITTVDENQKKLIMDLPDGILTI
jgi:16S rRNA processing protein RimM